MKLLRVGEKGKEQPAILDNNDEIRDVSSLLDDWHGENIYRENLNKFNDLTSLPIVAKDTRIGSCIPRPGKIIAVGLNYTDHAKEANLEVPSEPIIFMKATTSFSGPFDPVVIPKDSHKTDWEVELGVVIGKPARYVSEDAAKDHIAGFCVIHDVSEREHQIEKCGQWVKGKSHDTFCPTGPWLVTPDEVGDPHNLKMWLEVDGKMRQNGNSNTIVFNSYHLVSYISNFMTLETGDLITTGTPPGVGLGCNPPEYLKEGMTVRLGIEKLGEQQQSIEKYK